MDLTMVVGIDPSGPTNTSDTCVAIFECREAALTLATTINGGTDEMILGAVKDMCTRAPAVVGIDAPLSYNPGGKLRPRDKALRERIFDRGYDKRHVMPPTMNRMVYLTLRGICLARLLTTNIPDRCRIVEVHPGATMVLNGADVCCVKRYKERQGVQMGAQRSSAAYQEHNEVRREAGKARGELLKWFGEQGVAGIKPNAECTDHFVSAVAAAVAARDWHMGRSAWEKKAEPPLHPFDFAC